MRRATRRTSASVLSALVLCAIGGGAQAQDGSQAEPARVDDVVVLGTSLRDQIGTFVGAVTAPPRGRGPARWNERAGVCVGVANLEPVSAQFVADRVSDVADFLHLPVGEPGCGANVLVMFTDDAPTLAAALVERSPNAFRPDYAGAAASKARLADFTTSDRAIRWWHVAIPLTESGAVAVRMPGSDIIPRIRSTPSRLTTPIRNELRRAFIIVDVDQVEDLTLTQLSDYVAMVAFAQIDPDHEVGDFPSILNVVAHPTAASEMTDWDRAYLQALYEVELNRRNPAVQMGPIASDMHRTVRDGEPPDEGSEPDAPPDD